MALTSPFAAEELLKECGLDERHPSGGGGGAEGAPKVMVLLLLLFRPLVINDFEALLPLTGECGGEVADPREEAVMLPLP